MPDTTYEEARRCPKCEHPGKEVKQLRAPNGNGKLVFFECAHEGCKWFDNGTYMVQVDATGKIVEPNMDSRDKSFPVLPSSAINRGSSAIDEALHLPEEI